MKTETGRKANKRKPIVRSSSKPPSRQHVQDEVDKFQRSLTRVAIAAATSSPESVQLADHMSPWEIATFESIAEREGKTPSELLASMVADALRRLKGEPRLPVFLPAYEVTFLRQICAAAGVEGGADGYIERSMRGEINDTFRTVRPPAGTPALTSDGRAPRGVEGLISTLLETEELPDYDKAMHGMLDVLDQWKMGAPD